MMVEIIWKVIKTIKEEKKNKTLTNMTNDFPLNL